MLSPLIDLFMASKNNTNLEYSRQELRKATKFVEGDYKGINPREFYRSLKRSLEEIQEAGDFKYRTHGSQETDLDIESETVGEKTGTVKGRLMATSDPREIGHAEIEYRPYGPYGIAGLLLGGLVFLGGLFAEILLLFAGILILGVSGYLFLQQQTGVFPVEREDIIRVLITGEVSERTIDEGGETRTDILANMSVIYAGDAFLNVSTEEFPEMNWPLRLAITMRVDQIYNQLVDEPEDKVPVETGIAGYLDAWSDFNGERNGSTIQNRQRIINDDFEMRVEYTNRLMDELPNDVRDELTDHQNAILDELEGLSEDMDVYVDREGLTKLD